ncbi:hypothetical protein LCGC14_2367630 [marine sediment metagenome]|uniref:Uncharacterized protein n=1 Tax=marine sediment metagenome TaxID=412755 RepID=A0A0F9C4P5_9ZZZZ
MALNRNRDAFIDGGIKGILLFEGTLTGVEEDIPNEYQEKKLQARIDFDDVEILESEDAVALEDDNFHFFFTQSNKKGSVNEKVVEKFDDYAQKHNIEGIAIDNLEGLRIIYAREVVDYGKDMNSAKFWYPCAPAKGADIEAIKKECFGKGKGKGKGSKKADGSSALQELILEAGGMGETLEGFKKSIKSAPADTRKAVQAGGGLDAVLTALVETELLSLEDGVYTTVA